jgi:bacillithiol biosynthesis cysteine-adding enzyme BshC
MDARTIPAAELPHTTKLFRSYLTEFARVAPFYAYAPTAEAERASAAGVRLSPAVRARVVEILRAQNRAFGADASTFQSLDRLASGAVAVVTGQQVGLFSGPAYSFYKALSAIRWAKELTGQGMDAVPVFWLATEDHDLAEISHCALLDSTGAAQNISLDTSSYAAGSSVGRIAFGSEISTAVRTAQDALAGLHAREIAQALDAAYRPGENFGSAFARLLARLLGARGLILLDPLDVSLRPLMAPVLRRAAEEHEALSAALLARSTELDRAGFHAQVKVTQRGSLLFADVDGRRTPVRRGNHGFAAGGEQWDGAALAAAIEREPERFTANVLLRPVVQDSLLPTAAIVGGPAEIAYLAQSEVLYRRLLGRMPVVLPRAGFTFVEPNVRRLLKKYGLEATELSAGRQIVRARMEQAALPKDLARRFAAGEKTLRRVLAGLKPALEKLDPALLGARETAERKMLYQFGKLRGKAGRAENFRTGVLDRHERTLFDSLYPHRGLQERSICLLSFLARHGTALLDALEAHAAEFASHHIVDL